MGIVAFLAIERCAHVQESAFELFLEWAFAFTVVLVPKSCSFRKGANLRQALALAALRIPELAYIALKRREIGGALNTSAT